MKNQTLNTTRRLGSRLLPLALGAAALIAGSLPAGAQNYWDTNQNGAGVGGTGNWDILPVATLNWNNADGTTGAHFWPNLAVSDAVFTGTPGTVTLTDTGVQVRKMSFLVSGYVLNALPGQTLALANGGMIEVNGVNTTIIPASLTGMNLVKTGTGDNQLDLRGLNNVITGRVTVEQGELKLSFGGKINTTETASTK